MNDLQLNNLISNYGWFDLPTNIISREGKKIDSSSDRWDLPYSIWKSTALDFRKISNNKLRWAVKSYVRDRLERVSIHAGYSAFQEVYSELLRHANEFDIKTVSEFKLQLISLIEARISTARKDHRLWALYRAIQWYIYCAENYPELGFCQAYALELEGMSIPGSPKGEAVRMNDPEKGPLHSSLELPLLICAMKADTSQEIEHLQQKVAIALSIAYGRNPANLTFLREEDFIDLTPNAEERCYVLKMPRIKKRQLNPRDDFLEEYVEPLYARYILELISKNSEVRVEFKSGGKVIPNPRPLFINQNGNRAALLSNDLENAYNMTSADITSLVKGFVERHDIVSPITKRLLQLTTRRLRYTLAVGLAAEGISKKELARILDHSDTQHVLVYFEMAGKVIEHLDKAAAKGLSRYIKYFKGKIIDNGEVAFNGDRLDKHVAYIDEEDPTVQDDIGVCGESGVCHLDPPYSCYICPKFQPYRQADHEHVLECLLHSREQRLNNYDNARLGIQLDEVIAAVAQVTELCSVESSNG